MLVRDVMTVAVITASPDTTVKELAQLLVGGRIGGVPIVEGGELAGIVTTSDLLQIREAPASTARVAADVMTKNLVTLTEGTSVTGAARVLARYGVKRAPVVRGTRLVGIVTRSDLLRPYLRTDSEIRAEVEDSVLVQSLGLNPRTIAVSVDDGVVTLQGRVASPDVRELLTRLCRSVAGVVDVVERVDVTPAEAATA